MSSDNEKAPLIQKHSGKMTTLAAFNTAFNVMLGTGPILVPPVFQQPGLILAFGFVVIITCLSFVCAEFVIETMSLLTAIRARKEAVRVIEEESSSITAPNGKQIQNRADVNYQSEEFEDDTDRTEFHYKEGIEYGQMALEIFGKNGQAVVASVLVVYLVGVLSSKTIMIGTILSTAFSGVNFLDSRYTWIISFFTCSVLFSFKNVQSTKLLQNIIILVRFFTIASLLIGSVQVIIVDGIHSMYELHTLIDFGNFTSFFGDLQFALLLHHAIPSMFASIEKQQDVKKVLFAAITIGSLSLLLLSIFGMLAFGQCLNSQTEPNCAPTYVNGSSYFNNYFKGVANTDWVFYISSFYIFLNIAAFPVLIITARNNLMKFVMPHKITPQINKWTVFFTVLITGPIITIALLTTNIQLVLDWISGIFGSMLISLFPSTFLIFARKQASKLGINYQNSLHKSYISHKYLPYVTLLIGSGLLVFTLYNNFKKYT